MRRRTRPLDERECSALVSNARRSAGIAEEGLAEVATQRRAGAAIASRVSFTVDPAADMEDYPIKWPTTELAHMLTGKRPRSTIPTPVYYTKTAAAPHCPNRVHTSPTPTLSPTIQRWWDADIIFTLSEEMIADMEVYSPEVVLVDEEGDGDRGDEEGMVTLIQSEMEHQVMHLELYAHRSWQIRMALLETANTHIRSKSTSSSSIVASSAPTGPSPGTRRRLRTRRVTEEDQDEDDATEQQANNSEQQPSAPLSIPISLGGLCEPLKEAVPYTLVSHIATQFVYDTWLRWRGYGADMSRPWGLPLIPSLFEAVPSDDFFIPVTDLRTRLATGTVHLRGLTCSLTADIAKVADPPGTAVSSPTQETAPNEEDWDALPHPAMGGSLVDPTFFPFPLPEALRVALRPTFAGGQYKRVLQAMEVSLPTPAEIGGVDGGAEDWGQQQQHQPTRSNRTVSKEGDAFVKYLSSRKISDDDVQL